MLHVKQYAIIFTMQHKIRFNLKRNRWPPWDIRHSEKKANAITEFLLFLESENNWKDSWLYDDLQKLQKTHFI